MRTHTWHSLNMQERVKLFLIFNGTFFALINEFYFKLFYFILIYFTITKDNLLGIVLTSEEPETQFNSGIILLLR